MTITIADKLLEIAENEPKVYHAGKLAVLKASKYMNATASGTAITVNDVSPVEHEVEVTVRSKNLLDLSQYTFVGCTNNGDGTLTANMSNVLYCRISTEALSNLLFDNRGKSFTFSVKEMPADTRLTVVIYGKRPYDNQFKQYNGDKGSTTITFTVGTEFETVTSIDLRMLGKDARYDDTTTVMRDIQLEFGDTATAYTPYIEDMSQITVVANPDAEMIGYAVSADGTVEGVKSVSPSMTLSSDTEGAVLTCSYLRDIDRYIDNLTGGSE